MHESAVNIMLSCHAQIEAVFMGGEPLGVENPFPYEFRAQIPLFSQRTRKIFIGGLADSVDEEALREYFEQFGEVFTAVVMYDHETRRPRGFGFVTFAVEESVDNVLRQGAFQYIHEKEVEIKPAASVTSRRAVPRDVMPRASMYRQQQLMQLQLQHLMQLEQLRLQQLMQLQQLQQA